MPWRRAGSFSWSTQFHNGQAHRRQGQSELAILKWVDFWRSNLGSFPQIRNLLLRWIFRAAHLFPCVQRVAMRSIHTANDRVCMFRDASQVEGDGFVRSICARLDQIPRRNHDRSILAARDQGVLAGDVKLLV